MKNQKTTGSRKAQYQPLVDMYLPLLEQVVSVDYRKAANNYGDLDDFQITGELLEVKAQGLCIAQDNDDGESFIPFCQVRAYAKHEWKLYFEDFDYISNLK